MKKLTPGDIREAVYRQVTDVHIDDKERAVDIVTGIAREEGRVLTEADLRYALGLARQLAVWSTVKSGLTEIRTASLSDTPYSRQTEDEWLEAFSPFINRVREKAFGAPDPPFDADSLDEMQEWIEKADEEERWAEIDPDSHMGKLESEIHERMDQLDALAPRRFRFGRTYGFHFAYLDSDNQLRRVQIDSVPRDLRRRRGFLDFDLPPIGIVGIAAHQVARITGFESHDVLLYILTGIPPRLRRAVVSGLEVQHILPNGTKVTGAVVEVSIRTPDVTWRELLQVHRDVQSMWESMGHSQPGKHRQRPRLTKKDRQLMEILDHLGGPPEKPDAGFWDDVHQEWEAAGYNAGPGKQRQLADSHRRHWRILKEKLEIPGVLPPLGADTLERSYDQEED